MKTHKNMFYLGYNNHVLSGNQARCSLFKEEFRECLKSFTFQQQNEISNKNHSWKTRRVQIVQKDFFPPLESSLILPCAQCSVTQPHTE